MEMRLVATHFLDKEPPTRGPERPAHARLDAASCLRVTTFRLEHRVPVGQAALPSFGVYLLLLPWLRRTSRSP